MIDRKTDIDRQKTIKHIFASAIELGSDDRETYIKNACKNDGELISEVRSWLTSYDESEHFIETPVFSATSLVDQPSPMTGRHFGNFEIIREIGSGGMGAVYLAKRTDGEFDQDVALKIVRQSIAESQLIERFRRERQILASLNHPNIAKLLDGGVSDEGLPFFAMEYINGRSIIEFASTQNLEISARLKLFLKVCSAVAYAHRNLVVHRDLKPGNILVDQEGEPKLLDFGLAKLVNEDLLADATQTQTAFRALTPAYASPEQLKGEPLTTASDIYSLGVVFYELLARRRPFILEGKSLDQIINTVTSTAPLPPSSQSVAPTPQLKGDLDNIALMALRYEADRRYSTVEQFSEDIERYLSGMPVTARSNTLKYRASKYLKRHSIGVTAAFIVLLSLITGIVVSLWQTRQARTEKAKAEAVSTFLQTMLNSSSPEHGSNSSDQELTVRNVLDDASKRLAAEDLSGQPEVRAELQRIIGASYFALGQYDLADRNLNSALAVQKQLYGDNSVETLPTQIVLSSMWVARGENAKADNFYRQSLPILRTAYKNKTLKSDLFLTAFCDFAILLRAQGDSRGGEDLLRESLSLTAGDMTASHSLVDNSRIVFALTLADQGKTEEALRVVREEYDLILSRPDSLPIERGVNLIFMGRFEMELGDLAAAEKHLTEGEAIYRKLFSDTKLEIGDNLRLEAQTYYLQNRYAEAEVKINETIKIYESSTSRHYINFPTALIIKGMIYSKTKRLDEAEKILREAIALRSESLPATHFLSAVDIGALGEFLTAQGRFDEAEPLLTTSYEDLKASQDPGSPRIRTAAKSLQKLYIAWNKPDLAEKYAS